MPLPLKTWLRSFARPPASSAEARLRMLSALSRVAQTSERGEEILQFLSEAMLSLLGAQRVLLFARQGQELLLRAVSGALERSSDTPLKIPLFKEDGDPVLSLLELPLEGSGLTPTLSGMGFSLQRTHLFPLAPQGKLLGILALEHAHSGSLPPEDQLLLQVFLPLCSLILKQTLLLEELSDQNAELESLLSLVQKINEESDPMKTLSAILKEALLRTRATSGSLIFVDSLRKKLRILTQEGLPENIERSLILDIGQGITGWVARERKPLLVPDVRKDPRYVCAKEEVRSELAVPIFYGGEVVGVLNVDHTEVHAFTEKHLRFLTTLAGLISAKLRIVFQDLNVRELFPENP